jgi:hypothetical protein
MHGINSNPTNAMEKAIDDTGLRRTPSNHIEWRKDHDQYPRNWPTYRKSWDTAIIVIFEFYTLSQTTLLKSNATDDEIGL